MRARRWTRWLALNALVIVATPVLFGWWLDRVVTEEYRTGARVSTDGDTIAIPISGITFLVTWVAIAVNAAVALVWLVRGQRQQGRKPAAYAGRVAVVVVAAIVLAIGLPWLVMSAVFGVLALLL
jgi:hypothetical protein